MSSSESNGVDSWDFSFVLGGHMKFEPRLPKNPIDPLGLVWMGLKFSVEAGAKIDLSFGEDLKIWDSNDKSAKWTIVRDQLANDILGGGDQ